MARKSKNMPLVKRAAATRHLAPRAARGRRSSEARTSGEGDSLETAPHPARSARHPLPAGGEREESPLAAGSLYRLMAWLSPAFPVGAFSYSSGIEWAVEAGDIKDAATLKAWLGVMLTEGGGMTDAVLFAHAHRAAGAASDKMLHEVAALAAAFAPSKERHLETTAQGNAFVEATRAAWPCDAIERLKTVWNGPVVYPVAVAVAAAGHGISLEPALAAYLQAVAANWVSAGVRLIPLGQSDGQRVLAALEPLVAAAARRAPGTKLDDIGSSAFRADLASARHETQYTRLFRS
jgi:urease accessory protein